MMFSYTDGMIYTYNYAFLKSVQSVYFYGKIYGFYNERK